MTLLSRRVRKTVRSLMYSISNSNGAGGGYHCTPKIGGRFTGKVAFDASSNNLTTHDHRSKVTSNSSSSMNHKNGNTVGVAISREMTAGDSKSKAIYQKENLLDEHLVRKIFVAGHGCLRIGAQKAWVDISLRDYFCRVEAKKRHGTWAKMPRFPSMDDDSMPSDEMGHYRKRFSGKDGNLSYVPSTVRTGTTNASRVNGHSSVHPPSSVGDPIGAAFTILLYLSESRWDYVAALARLSSKKAGLEFDVNQQTHNIPTDSFGTTSIPPPPPRKRTGFNTDELPDPPQKASGISLREISFLIAMALRSSRKQRLILLFHLLLTPKDLDKLLGSHSAGGIPTWLLEVQTDWILSFASLGHYYYYGGNCASGSEDDEEKHISESVSAPKELKVDTLVAIETLAVLLHCDGDSERNTGESIVSSRTEKQGNRERTLSHGDKKYNSAKAHVMLAEYLQEVRGSDSMPDFENESERELRIELLDTFWDASHASYNQQLKHRKESVKRGANSDSPFSPSSWTLAEYLNWADLALPNDTAIDLIMNQLFGMGLLPTASMERALVSQTWIEWQNGCMPDRLDDTGETISSVVTQGIRKMFAFSKPVHDSMDNASVSENGTLATGYAWGGIGNFDGGGGLGNGVMYCVDKLWWDDWTCYVGWEWRADKTNSSRRSRNRPHDLSTEKLLDRNSDGVVGGTHGSYEVMKRKLKKDIDYVLVPPAVWDVLYELYGGGPPLPRMIVKQEEGWFIDTSVVGTILHSEVMEKPNRLPRCLTVATHPWVLSCHVCDPHQPYRRGNVKEVSIRIMVTPEQPLWRLCAEVVLRLPVIHPRGKDASGMGRGRLWKKILGNGDQSKSGTLRYGPWTLLCKRGSASFPVENNVELEQKGYEVQQSWEAYGDNATVESAGLIDGMSLMFEYGLCQKDGTFAWPRETAAKEGEKKREEAEDLAFRRLLRGVDEKDVLVRNPRELIGVVVDCMDSNGRWYQAEIMNVTTSHNVAGEEGKASGDNEERGNNEAVSHEVKAVRVDFADVGGREEWINVASERLALLERFTHDSIKCMDNLGPVNGGAGNSNEGKISNRSLVLRKHLGNECSAFKLSSSVCSFPGFGACGLLNLGNTCYVNSAVQCISYMPLLRSYLVSGQYKRNGDLNKRNPLGSGGKILEEFSELLKMMWSGRYGVKSPTKFRFQLGRARQQYAAGDQQDAQELLNDMLDTLHEDSNRILDKPYVEALDDNWVRKTDLPRVGTETWRRFLRRNRSIITDTAMGQVLNRVTCPQCNHTSLNFDPFSMLSVPFPTTADVIFRCRIFYRVSSLNCPRTLGVVPQRRGESNLSLSSSSSNNVLIKDFIIPMRRLADISELTMEVEKIGGIHSSRLKLFTVDENDDSVSQHTCLNLTSLSQKEGPCLQLLKEPGTEQGRTSMVPTTRIFAFESTLNPRPSDSQNKSNRIDTEMIEEDKITSDNNNEDEVNNSKLKADKEDRAAQRHLLELLRNYGDQAECRLYDTDPVPLAKALSRGLWPMTAAELYVGLRVDAIDHKNQWFPGTIVEVVDFEGRVNNTNNTSSKRPKVKVHFDNFSSKWDLPFTIDHFDHGRVKPIYSQCQPRKPVEFQVFHRNAFTPSLPFGQTFFVQCHNEWNTVRAGAHIFSQAARFLEGSLGADCSTRIAETKIDDSDLLKINNENCDLLGEVIDILIEADRKYALSAMSIASGTANSDLGFDPISLSNLLSKKLGTLLPLLPFDILVCDNPSQEEKSTEDTPFAFSLFRTIGNYMNVRQSLVLCWRDIDKPIDPSNIMSLLYVPPPIHVDHESHEILKAGSDTDGKEINMSHIPPTCLRVGDCLDEFCKVQQLGQSESWRCPKCKEVREGQQSMTLWRLPDLLTFHLKRFNCSARWREKITTKVNFPLTGLNMKEWCDNESPVLQGSDDSYVYDLIGVVNHLGGMTGGHYVANCKASICSPNGSEEVEHNFNGAGVHVFGEEEVLQTGGWKLARSKDKDTTNEHTRTALSAQKSVAESSEPLWLQFDDDLVEPIPPTQVVSEMAYVLFYRRRRISPSNISRYSTMF